MTLARIPGRLVLLLFVLVCGSCTVGAEDRAYPSAEEVQPLAVDARVPSVEVFTVRGEGIDLADLVSEQGALLVFYRGGW